MASFVMSPLAWKAVRYGALAAMALYASRQRSSEPKDVEHQRTLDDLPEGFTAHAHRAEAERGVQRLRGVPGGHELSEPRGR